MDQPYEGSHPQALSPRDSVTRGIGRMEQTGASCLPVAGRDLDGSAVLGAVTYRRLMEECAEGGHDPERCSVSNHLDADVGLVTEGEYHTERLAIENAPRPVVVLDANGRPLHAVAASS